MHTVHVAIVGVDEPVKVGREPRLRVVHLLRVHQIQGDERAAALKSVVGVGDEAVDSRQHLRLATSVLLCRRRVDHQDVHHGTIVAAVVIRCLRCGRARGRETVGVFRGERVRHVPQGVEAAA